MKRALRCGLWAVVFLAAAGAGAQPAPGPGPQVLLRLPEKASVIGPEVRLGEIAEIITPDKGLTQRLLRLVVARAAPAGQVLTFSQAALRIALYREGYDLKTIQFSGPDTMRILTASQSFAESALLPDAKAFVAAQLKEDPANVDVRLSSSDKDIILPAGDVKAKFLPSFSGEYQGLVLLTAQLTVDGREVRDMPLRLNIDVMRPAVVTKAAVQKGGRFSEDNVEVKRWPEAKSPPGALRELTGVVGRTSAAFLPPGSVVALDDLYDPPVIHRGAEVNGVMQMGNVELTVTVKALSDGKTGDVIRVENTDTHKMLKAKVQDEKTVLIQAEQP